MTDTGATIRGLTGKWLFGAVCADALKNGGKAVIIVAEKDGDMLGFVLAIIDPRRYWQKFNIAHPFVATRIFISKVLKRMSIVLEGNTVLGTPDSAEDDFPGVAREESHARKWEDSSPDIAKIKHIGIAAPYRNLFNILSARIRLHLSTGWRLFRKPYNIFATIDLKK